MSATTPFFLDHRKLREAYRIHMLRLGRVPRDTWRCFYHDKPLCRLHNKCDDPEIGCQVPQCWPELNPIPDLSPPCSPAPYRCYSPPRSPQLAPPSDLDAVEVITIDDEPPVRDRDAEFRLTAREAAEADRESQELADRCRMYLSRVRTVSVSPSIIRRRRIHKDKFIILLEQAHRWYPDVVDSPK